MFDLAGKTALVTGATTGIGSALWEDPETCAKALAGYPLARLGEPDDIAGAGRERRL